jgi:hypothetical protein
MISFNFNSLHRLIKAVAGKAQFGYLTSHDQQAKPKTKKPAIAFRKNEAHSS